MSGEMRPLNVVLRELTALVRRKVTGLFCIVTQDNRFASIKLRDGRILEVAFRSMFNESAIEQLSHVREARATFQQGLVGTLKHELPGEAALRWLLGGFEKQSDVALSAPARIGSHTTVNETQKHVIEEVAISFLGPIASMVCEDVFATTNDFDSVIRQISVNLDDREEAARFAAAVREALMG